MTNYTKTTIGKENRIELHEKLSLTGAEISLNELPAGYKTCTLLRHIREYPQDLEVALYGHSSFLLLLSDQ